MNNNLRLLHPSSDQSHHDFIKRNVINEISSDILRRNYKVIESFHEDEVKQETLHGFSVRTEPEETIQVKTNNGLYIKISTKEIKGDK
ncbi:hypothetical protein [Staphylococcus equorum]|uniref:Uncharacterized protein n=1 Tax=Staphylococcus equorum TaxID=246432 RepID=A0A9X4R5F3_9STAP|nr:hypothetical protein [Staphylococcus equorum]MDG0860383.1 hypothetical protein [Staphylococcus equorum]